MTFSTVEHGSRAVHGADAQTHPTRTAMPTSLWSSGCWTGTPSCTAKTIRQIKTNNFRFERMRIDWEGLRLAWGLLRGKLGLRPPKSLCA